MHSHSRCLEAAHRAVKVSSVVMLILIFLAIGAAAWAQAPNAGTGEVLRQAKVYQYQFRAGKMDIVPEYVAMLKEATRAEPDNADVWCAMGTAYLTQAARAMMPGGNPADALPAMQKGPAALRRALS